MRFILILFTLIYSNGSIAQNSVNIDVMDIRPGHDTVKKSIRLPSDRHLTQTYICRMFDFCRTLYEKAALLTPMPGEQEMINTRMDKSQRILIRDSLNRLKTDIFLTCLTCAIKSWGRFITYEDTTNTVIVYELTDDELDFVSQNKSVPVINTQNRAKTIIVYDKEDSIRQVTYQKDGKILFSVIKSQ